MADIWRASNLAKPLALGFGGAYGAPTRKIEELATLIEHFLYTFSNLEIISKRQNTFVERLPTFIQTVDECRDFLYDYDALKQNLRPFSKRELLNRGIKLPYKLPRYVYTDEDIPKLQDRLHFQLYAMDATLDDIMLRAFIKITKPDVTPYDNATQQKLSPPFSIENQAGLGNNVRYLYNEIERIDNTLKRMGPQGIPNLIDDKTPVTPDDTEIIKLRNALKSRIGDHILQDDEPSNFLQFQDDDSLLRYSGEKLKRLEAALNMHSSMIIRKRIFGYDGETPVNLRSSDPITIATNIRISRARGDDKFYPLKAIDVVDYVKNNQVKRFVICTDKYGKIGLIHHLPPTVIYPFTKHEKIIRQTGRGLLLGKNEVSLVESSVVEIVGIEQEQSVAVNPRYSFEDDSDMTGFQGTLRGKHILHTLEVDIVKSNRGSEARAQHLKIWSAVDDGQVSLSFYSHEVEPKSHLELPLIYFEPVVTFRGDTIIKIDFKYKAPRRRSRPFRRRSSLMSFGHGSGHSTTTGLEGSNTPESDESAISMQSDESSVLSQVFTTIGKMGYLEIQFTKPEGLVIFTDELKKRFSRAPIPVLDPFPESPPPGPRPRTSLRRPPSTTPPPPSPKTDTSPTMFRVQGIPYSCLNGGTRHLIRNALGLEDDAEITTTSLAVSPDPAKLTAVIYFKNVPEQLSSEEFLKVQELKVSFSTVSPVDQSKDSVESHEWITFDTHFRNLTVLRTVKPGDGQKHTVDICAVSGLGAHAWGSFRERKGKFMWLVDSLPEQFKGARIMTYGFETKLRNNNSIQSLNDLAGYLLSDLKNLRASLSSPTAVPLVFIAHSLGGLVVKEAMVHAKRHHDEDFISSIKGSLFFGVPSEGMDINSLRPLVEGQPNEALLMSLERGSTALSVQNGLYAGFFEDYLKPPVAFFYENKLSPTAREVAIGRWKLDGPETHLVSASSATCGYYNKSSHICRSMEKNHSELVKFNGPHDGEYLHVLPILKQFIPES